MPEMLQANTQKVKYPWIRKLFGKRNRKNGRGDEKKRNRPSLKSELVNLLLYTNKNYSLTLHHHK